MVHVYDREKIADTVARLCKEAMNYRNPVWDWLYVLPLYNFMMGYSEPFMRPEYDINRIRIGARADKLNFKDLRSKIPIGYADYSMCSCGL